MVSPENMHFGGILDLECKEEADGLDALPPSINIVSQEEVA
jgi:hypothetical protein